MKSLAALRVYSGALSIALEWDPPAALLLAWLVSAAPPGDWVRLAGKDATSTLGIKRAALVRARDALAERKLIDVDKGRVRLRKDEARTLARAIAKVSVSNIEVSVSGISIDDADCKVSVSDVDDGLSASARGGKEALQLIAGETKVQVRSAGWVGGEGTPDAVADATPAPQPRDRPPEPEPERPRVVDRARATPPLATTECVGCAGAFPLRDLDERGVCAACADAEFEAAMAATEALLGKKAKKAKPAIVEALEAIPNPEQPPSKAPSKGRLYPVRRGEVSRELMAEWARGDHDAAAPEGKKVARFDALMRVVTGIRAEVHGMDVATFDGGDCAIVRRALTALKPSEVVLAVAGVANDPFWRDRNPGLKQVLADPTRFIALAKQGKRAPSKEDAVTAYLAARRDYEVECPWEAHDDPALESPSIKTAAELTDLAASMREAVSKKRAARGLPPLAPRAPRELGGAR